MTTQDSRVTKNNNNDIMNNQESFFEGTEKNLKLLFQPSEDSLRSISRQSWQGILDSVRCTILSEKSNKVVTAYLLSESSLFVYDTKVVIKTCGRTVLFKFLQTLEQSIASHKLKMKLSTLFYTRKEYLRPKEQPDPHQTFEQEIGFINRHYKKMGTYKKFGDYFIYFLQFNDNAQKITKLRHKELQKHYMYEILMNDLAVKNMKIFFKNGLKPNQVTKQSGVADLVPNSKIDDYLFDPCGYSGNGILGNEYWTIHVTPEDTHSYVSFEANNTKIVLKDYAKMTSAVCQLFGPKKFGIVVMSERIVTKKDMLLKRYQCKSAETFDLKNGLRLNVFQFEGS